MCEKVDRRIRKTRALLRDGLAHLMQRKTIHEITVSELVKEIDINRSTFYLHYQDIYQMLESIEQEITEQIRATLRDIPAAPIAPDNSPPYLIHIFSYLAENREICNALLGPHGDMAFVERIEHLVADTVFSSLSSQFPRTTPKQIYTYSFCLTGLVGMVKIWLSAETPENPRYMAELTHHLFRSISDYISQADHLPASTHGCVHNASIEKSDH